MGGVKPWFELPLLWLLGILILWHVRKVSASIQRPTELQETAIPDHSEAQVEALTLPSRHLLGMGFATENTCDVEVGSHCPFHYTVCHPPTNTTWSLCTPWRLTYRRKLRRALKRHGFVPTSAPTLGWRTVGALWKQGVRLGCINVRVLDDGVYNETLAREIIEFVEEETYPTLELCLAVIVPTIFGLIICWFCCCA